MVNLICCCMDCIYWAVDTRWNHHVCNLPLNKIVSFKPITLFFKSVEFRRFISIWRFCFISSFSTALIFKGLLEGMALYAGQLLAPAEGFGLRPRLFCTSGIKGLICCFVPILGHFWCSVVTLVIFRNNLSNKNPKKSKKSKS